MALGLSGCSTRGMAAITRKNVLKNLKDFRLREGPKKDAKGQEGTSRRPRGRQERLGPINRVPGLCNIQPTAKVGQADRTARPLLLPFPVDRFRRKTKPDFAHKKKKIPDVGETQHQDTDETETGSAEIY